MLAVLISYMWLQLKLEWIIYPFRPAMYWNQVNIWRRFPRERRPSELNRKWCNFLFCSLIYVQFFNSVLSLFQVLLSFVFIEAKLRSYWLMYNISPHGFSRVGVWENSSFDLGTSPCLSICSILKYLLIVFSFNLWVELLIWPYFVWM